MLNVGDRVRVKAGWQFSDLVGTVVKINEVSDFALVQEDYRQEAFTVSGKFNDLPEKWWHLIGSLEIIAAKDSLVACPMCEFGDEPANCLTATMNGVNYYRCNNCGASFEGKG